MRLAKSVPHVESGRHLYRKCRWLTAAAAATLATLPGGASGFSLLPISGARRKIHPWESSKPVALVVSSRRQTTLATRQFSNLNNNNNNNNNRNNRKSDKSGGILGSLQSVAKSVLPSSWFQSEAEKQKAMERQQYKDQVSGGIREVLKDAPLPIRMMGRLMGPLVSTAMSSMAEGLADQQKTIADYQQQAQRYLQADEAVRQVLGDTLQMSATPYSQSSSTTSINGQSTTRVQLQFQVSGSRGTGIAELAATEAGISRLVLQAEGRSIQVNLSAAPSKRFSSARRGDDKGDIIEAEIVDKDTTPR
jgi:hypothetical protein